MAASVNANGKRPAEAASQTTAKKSKTEYKSVITVVVGEPGTEFIIHEDLICDRSPFFKVACSNGWKEAQTHTVTLPDIQPKTFKIYLDWAYSQTKDLVTLAPSPDDQSLQTEHRIQIKAMCRLCKLWCLADYLQDAKCKNEVIDNLIRGQEQRKLAMSLNTLNLAYAQSTDGSGLRRWAVDVLLAGITSASIAKHRHDLSAAMSVDLLVTLLAKNESNEAAKTPLASDAWKYYE